MSDPRTVPARLLTVVVVALLAVAVMAAPASAAPVTPHAAAPATRVIIIGDSITQGRDGDWTWRYRLAKEATRQGARIDFVGSELPTWAGQGRYADANFDRQHFSRWGITLERQAPLVEAEVRAQAPDVVVMATGIVDLSTQTVPQVETTLRQWIANVRAGKPDVRIVISPTLARSEFVTPQKVASFAARERAVAAELSTSTSPITVADTDRGWRFQTMTWDGTHPVCTGENHIAYRVGQELARVGVLPRQPPAPGRCTTPRPLEAVTEIRFGANRIAWQPVPRASSYQVRYQVRGSNRWINRTVRTEALRVKSVRKARVWPANPAGRGPSKVAVRPTA